MPTGRVPAPQLAAKFAADTANARERRIDVMFYSGAAVPRFSWTLGGEYMLAFSTTPGAVNLTSLNSGSAPIFYAHSGSRKASRRSARARRTVVLGVVEKGWLKDGTASATLRFAKGDEDADRVWNKIEQKVLRNVSMGVRIHKMKETSGTEDKVKSYLATEWEPFEISVVPIGADPGAHIRMSAEMGEQEIDLSEDESAVLSMVRLRQIEIARLRV